MNSPLARWMSSSLFSSYLLDPAIIWYCLSLKIRKFISRFLLHSRLTKDNISIFASNWIMRVRHFLKGGGRGMDKSAIFDWHPRQLSVLDWQNRHWFGSEAKKEEKKYLNLKNPKSTNWQYDALTSMGTFMYLFLLRLKRFYEFSFSSKLW